MRDSDSGHASSIKRRRKNMIMAVLGLCVLGSIIYRWSHTAGTIITFAAILVYLISDIKGTVNRGKNLSKMDPHNKWRFVMWCALLLVALSSLMSGKVPYFYSSGNFGRRLFNDRKRKQEIKMSIIRSALGLLVLSQILLVNGCGRENKEANIFFQDTLYMPSYASGFIIKSFGESSVLEIKNPWQGAADVGMQLFLSHNGEKAPDNFKGTVAEVPLKRVVCMSSSYVAFIDAIDETDVIKAVSGARYITNDTIRARFARGELRDVGYDSNLNYELIAGLRPDMVFIYGIAGEDRSVTEKFDEMSIPYIYIGDYVEQSPLGKAEWLVAFGEMFGRRDQALSTFVSIENNYLETCEIACDYVGTNKESFSGLPAKPLVMLNAPYRDTWFVPGDRSYIVKLINDAGGEYACVGDDSERSRPISAESAFLYASKADVWLNPGQASSMIELKELNPQFADIRAVKKGRVFNCNARTTAEGGSDFWESGAVRPDIVLKDLVKILHPELMRGYQLYYFKEIKLIRGLDVP